MWHPHKRWKYSGSCEMQFLGFLCEMISLSGCEFLALLFCFNWLNETVKMFKIKLSAIFEEINEYCKIFHESYIKSIKISR